MPGLSPQEQGVLATLDDRHDAMLARVEAWAAINSGSRNLDGLATMAGELAAAFGAIGEATLRDPSPVEAVDAAGRKQALAHGQNLHVARHGDAMTRVLLTGHMDTVFAADHPFQSGRWLDDRTLNAPGAADMKGGIVVMLTALTAFEASPFAKHLGWEVVINSDEEVSSLGSAALLAEAAQR